MRGFPSRARHLAGTLLVAAATILLAVGAVAAGQTMPSSAEPADDGLHMPRPPAYQDASKETLVDAVRDHWLFLAGFATFLGLAGLVVAYVARLNRKLRAALRENHTELEHRKQTEEALRRNHEEVRAFYDGMHDGLLIADVETRRFVRTNPSMCRMLGYSENELLSLSVKDIHPADSLPHVLEQFAAMAQRQSTVATGLPVLRKDGNLLCADISAFPIIYHGRLCSIGFFHDITLCRRAEEALRSSETKYRMLFNSSRDAIMIAAPEKGFLSGNPAAVELFACKDEQEFVSYSPADLSPESQADGTPSAVKAQQMMAIAVQEGSHFFEWTHKRADGREFFATVLLTRMELEGARVLQATVRDITKQKLAEEAAKREGAKLWAMISGMDEGVVFADADNTIGEINEYFCRFVGIPREEILGKRLVDLHREAPLERILCHVDRFRKQVGSGPLVLQRPLGGKEVILRMQPIYRDGQYDGVLLNVSDVSELVNARQEAEAASKAKSAFLANMSHEIRTPMTAILGYTDLLTDPALGPSTRDNYLAVVRRNGEHLLRLINDILDLSKIEAGKLALDVRRCSLVSLLADVASMMRPRAEPRGNSLCVEYAGELPETILTDGARLRQALVNLAGNAVKFTENGSVRIRVSFLAAWRSGQPALQIEVIDTGIGIREEVLPRLFQPFSQGDASVGHKFGGTGLGLAISRHIAELLGGELVARSTLGQGSTFTLTIPSGELQGIQMLQCPAEAVEESRPDPCLLTGKDLAGVRILLAEDGFDNQQVICTILRRAGAAVEIAENGCVAVHKAESEPFDVILMDINMPEMDGYQATETLRERGYRGPILALTANAMSGDDQRCLAAGCNDYLTKPIDRARLIRTVAQYAGRASAGNEQASPSGDEIQPAAGEAIRSEFADDPEIAAILKGFIAGLEGQVGAMHKALADHRYEDLQRAAHQMKGSAGSYGYPALTDAAKALEDAMKNRDLAAAVPALERVAALCRAIEENHQPCARAGGGAR
jgi:PAS domain S-box-containing protein